MTTGVEIRICPISGDSELELFTEVLPIVSFKQKFKIGNVTFVFSTNGRFIAGLYQWSNTTVSLFCEGF